MELEVDPCTLPLLPFGCLHCRPHSASLAPFGHIAGLRPEFRHPYSKLCLHAVRTLCSQPPIRSQPGGAICPDKQLNPLQEQKTVGCHSCRDSRRLVQNPVNGPEAALQSAREDQETEGGAVPGQVGDSEIIPLFGLNVLFSLLRWDESPRASDKKRSMLGDQSAMKDCERPSDTGHYL